MLASNYPDIKRPLRARACVGPRTSSTMHYKVQSMATQKTNRIIKKGALTYTLIGKTETTLTGENM